MLQWALGLEWGGLSRWQQDTGYKVATGLLLGVFLAWQWFLSLCRTQRWRGIAKKMYSLHQMTGVFAPLLFFAHSTTLGVGYILILSSVYFTNALLGIASPSLSPALRRYAGPWMVSHVALSVVLIVLAVYHAWTALYFE